MCKCYCESGDSLAVFLIKLGFPLILIVMILPLLHHI